MSARPLSRGAAVALAAAALAFSPVAAHADDTPTATATTPAPVTTTVPAPTTTTSATGPSSSTTTTSADPSATTTSGSSTTSSSTSTSTAPTTAAKAAKAGALSFATPNLTDNSVAAVSPAANFIATTLAARGDHYNYPASTVFDGGNTIDAALGLDGAGEGLDKADAAVGYLEDNLAGYISGDSFGDAGSTYAGPLAKALLAAVAQGADPTAFGGVDLVTRLAGLEEPSGRFSDVSTFGDNSNTIGQSLAIIGLGRAGAPVSAASVDFLLAQQCADGGFRTFIGVSPCVSDVDTTGFALQALIGANTASDPGVVKGLGWLAGKQAANGGLPDSDGTLNANSTALAAQAFAAAGDTTRLAKGQAFLTSLQYDCSFPAAMRGGIAFTAADRAAAKAKGTKATVGDSDIRATPQATLALAGESLLTVEAGDGFGDTVPMECATTTSTSSSTTSHAGSSGSSSSPSASTPTGSLAFTGSEVWPLAFIAMAFILVGAGALVGSRRRGGAHA